LSLDMGFILSSCHIRVVPVGYPLWRTFPRCQQRHSRPCPHGRRRLEADLSSSVGRAYPHRFGVPAPAIGRGTKSRPQCGLSRRTEALVGTATQAPPLHPPDRSIRRRPAQDRRRPATRADGSPILWPHGATYSIITSQSAGKLDLPRFCFGLHTTMAPSVAPSTPVPSAEPRTHRQSRLSELYDAALRCLFDRQHVEAL
jgi:hypothetical protein